MSSKIIDFEEERSRHGQLFGREEVLARLDALLHQRARGYVVLLGSPGIGKSAIVSRMLDRLPDNTPHHFIRGGIEGWDRPEVIGDNLCAQIERIFPEKTNAELRPETRLGDLLRRVSRAHLAPENKRLILVLDGLDEVASQAPGKNPLESFLPRVLPPGVMILCASRPMYSHLDWLDQGDRVLRINLDDSAWAASNEAAVQAFWEYHGRQFVPPLPTAVVREAVRCAASNLLHAIRLRDWLEDLPPEQREAVKIPEGLIGFLNQIWTDLNLALDEDRRQRLMRGLAIACAAREALPEFVFGELIDGSTSAGSEFLRAVRPFLREDPAHWHNGQRAYRLYHEYFREFIASKLGDWDVRAAHRQLSEVLATWRPDERDPVKQAYALRHGVAHRLEAGDIDGARRLCADVSYLEAKVRALGVSAIERDFEAVARTLGGHVSLDLRAVLAAVSAEASRLCDDPGALPVQVYNRLRCSGWKAERIEGALRFDGGPPPLRLMHGVRLGPTRLRIFHGHEKPIVACIATPDGLHVLSASADSTLRLWALGSGDCVGVLRGHDGDLTGCILTPDGRTVISTSTDGTARIWDLADQQCRFTLENEGRWATTCALTPDGKRLVIGSDNGALTVWDFATRQRIATLAGHTDYVTACVVTLRGQLVSASRDKSVRVWDLKTGKCVHTLRDDELPLSLTPRSPEEHGWITTLALLPGGTHVLAASGDGTLTQWDLASGKVVRQFGAGQGRVDACAVLHEGRHLLCGVADGTMALWDLVSGQPFLRFTAHEKAISACVVTADGRRILSSSYDNSISIWELGEQESFASPDGHRESVTACAITPDGRIVVSASEDHTLKVWDVKTGACRKTLSGHAERVTACAISNDGSRVLSGASDGSVMVWNLENDRAEKAAGHQGPVSGCAFIPDGRMITASQDGTLRIWQPTNLDQPEVIPVRGASVDGLAITPDGVHALVISFREGTAQLWSLTSRCLVQQTPVSLAEALLAGAITPDGKRAVLGLSGGKLEVRDLHTRHLDRLIEGHAQRVLGCAVFPDGARVISASEDGTLRIWSLETKQCLGTIYGTSWFQCVTAVKGCICAGDQKGNLWIMVDEMAKSSAPQPRDDLPPQWHSRLRDKMAGIYESVKDARRIARDAGLDESRIYLEGTAQQAWDSVLNEALHQRRVYEVFEIALREYSKDPMLLLIEPLFWIG